MFNQPLLVFARNSLQTWQDVTGFSGGVAPAAAVYDCRDFRLLFTSCSTFRPRPPRTVSSFIVVMLLLVAGVEPRCARTLSVNFGLLNARSVVSKAAQIYDVISDLHLDVLAVTKTWVTSDAPDAIKLDVAPPSYQVIHQPRGSSTDNRGGGVAVVHLDSISVRPFDVGTFSEFVILAVKLSLQSPQNIVVVCLYRPPGAVSQIFCCQLADLLDQLILADQRFILCGDFNCPGEGDNHISSELHDVLQRYNLLQHVHEATHTGGNTLDLVLSPSDDASLVSEVSVCSTCFSDHHVISCRLGVPWHRPTVVHSQFRDLRRPTAHRSNHFPRRCAPVSSLPVQQ